MEMVDPVVALQNKIMFEKEAVLLQNQYAKLVQSRIASNVLKERFITDPSVAMDMKKMEANVRYQR